MNFLLSLVLALLKLFVPALKSAAKDECEDAPRQPVLKNELKSKIRAAGWSVILALTVLPASGCFIKSVYVPHGEPVRLRETVEDAKIWVMTADGPRASTMDLPEGWYCLPLDEEEAK